MKTPGGSSAYSTQVAGLSDANVSLIEPAEPETWTWLKVDDCPTFALLFGRVPT